MLGHLDRDCQKMARDIANGEIKEGKYGTWLKAAEIRNSNVSGQSSRSTYQGPEIPSDFNQTLNSPVPTGTNVEQHSEQQIVETPPQEDMDYTKTGEIVTH
ncbi:30S ribosomal protein S6e [Striga asiatica]|uniref:30S ribosomal protein S6e n=1 Tax=Striga asiatica TaxID=4170 RepID=A0A5A7PAE4_STRAF|nr:30S ribosomal protein S6e [Striga asiatica]